MRIVLKLLLVAAVIFILLQLFHPPISAKPATAEFAAPPEIRAIFEKDCYACHSDQRRLAWFDQIEPAYFLVRKDVLIAREHLNFSTLGSKPAAAQQATLYEAVNMMQLGAMPLPRFTALHPQAKVTSEDLAILKAYLAPWSTTPHASAATITTPPPTSISVIQPEFNSLAFDKDFGNWKPISFTDRGDNNSFRFILGNDIAANAAASGNIHPWPDGTRFAKIAWQQEEGADGLIHPGTSSPTRVHASLLVGKIQVFVGDVGHSDHQHPHAPSGAVDHPGRDVHDRALADVVGPPIQQHLSLAVEHVIQLRRAAMVVFAGTIDVDRMRPGVGRAGVLAADQPVAPATGASLPRNFSLVPHQGHQDFRFHVVGPRFANHFGALAAPESLIYRQNLGEMSVPFGPAWRGLPSPCAADYSGRRGSTLAHKTQLATRRRYGICPPRVSQWTVCPAVRLPAP